MTRTTDERVEMVGSYSRDGSLVRIELLTPGEIAIRTEALADNLWWRRK